MVSKFAVLVIVLSFFASISGSAQDDKSKDKQKTDNTETYTVHKSGDAGNGVPTYSTGGLNPNPQPKPAPKPDTKPTPKPDPKPAPKPDPKQKPNPQ